MTRMLGNAYYGDLPLVMQSMTSRRHETAPARHDEGTMADAPPPTTGADAVSDYGSDIGLEDFDEDTILADALCTIQAARPPAAERGTVLPSIEFEEGEREDEEQHVDGRPTLLRVAKDGHGIQSSPLRETLEVEYDARSRRAWSGTSPATAQHNTANYTRLTTDSV
jgi:hypothetical protein